MNSTFIIIFFLLRCLVLSYFTHFFGFLQDLQFSGNCSKNGKIGSSRPSIVVCKGRQTTAIFEPFNDRKGKWVQSILAYNLIHTYSNKSSILHH